MSYVNDVPETWLNPSSFLMMASNIKKGLKEYINESIEIDKINKNYESLKLLLTKMDADLKKIANNTSNVCAKGRMVDIMLRDRISRTPQNIASC